MQDAIILYENGKAIGGEGHPTDADDITFDNTGTDLVAETAQAAIVEVNAKTSGLTRMTKLWENPAPTASFSAQNITLASDDYDFLLLISKRTMSTNDTYSDIFCKTYSGCVCHTAPSSSGDMFYRLYTYVDDTHYSISDCTYQLMKTATQQTWNNGVVPVAIYGIKLI